MIKSVTLFLPEERRIRVFQVDTNCDNAWKYDFEQMIKKILNIEYILLSESDFNWIVKKLLREYKPYTEFNYRRSINDKFKIGFLTTDWEVDDYE